MPRPQHLAWTQNPPLDEHEGSNPSSPAKKELILWDFLKMQFRKKDLNVKNY